MRAAQFSKTLAIASFASVLLVSAQAAEIHYFSQGATLYNYNSGTSALSSVTTKDSTGADVKLSALAFDPNGVLWGQSPDQVNLTEGKFYTVNLLTGIVTFQFLMPVNTTVGARGNMNTFDFRQNGSSLEIVGFVDRSGGNQDTFERITTTGAFLGGYNTVSNNPSFPASAYDASTDTVYATNGSDFSARKYDPAGDSAGGTLLGSTGTSWTTAGGAFWNNDFWMSTGNASGTLTFGKVSKTTGAFTTQFTVGGLPVISSGNTHGYAISPVPEPTTMLALGLGALMVARRKRSK